MNPYSYVVLERDELPLSDFLIFADGISVVWAHRYLAGDRINRFSFDDTSIAPVVWGYARDTGVDVNLIGCSPGVVRINLK